VEGGVVIVEATTNESQTKRIFQTQGKATVLIINHKLTLDRLFRNIYNLYSIIFAVHLQGSQHIVYF